MVAVLPKTFIKTKHNNWANKFINLLTPGDEFFIKVPLRTA